MLRPHLSRTTRLTIVHSKPDTKFFAHVPLPATHSCTIPSSLNNTSLRRFLTKNLNLPISLIHRLLRNNMLAIYLHTDNPTFQTKPVDLNLKLPTGSKVVVCDPLVVLPASNFMSNKALGVKRPDLYSLRNGDLRKKALISNWIVYQDDKVFAINKPTGIAVHGGSGTLPEHDTVADLAQSLRENDTAYIPVPVHRIDKGTSGIVLLAKHRQVAEDLSAAMREKSLYKEYVAVLSGVVSPPAGRIQCDLFQGRLPNRDPNRPMQGSDHEIMHERTIVATSNSPPPPNARILSSETEYQVLASKPKSALSLVLMIPSTGRKHQLRVVAHQVLKAPIVGDYKYGYRDDGRNRDLHLHLMKLKLPWGPTIKAPLPKHFINTCKTGDLALPKSVCTFDPAKTPITK